MFFSPLASQLKAPVQARGSVELVIGVNFHLIEFCLIKGSNENCMINAISNNGGTSMWLPVWHGTVSGFIDSVGWLELLKLLLEDINGKLAV
jgi:hypothetical protein